MLGASTGLLWRGEVPPGAAAAAGAACLRLLLESPLEDGGLVVLPVWVGQSRCLDGVGGSLPAS